MEFLAYLAAPPIALFMDKMYYSSVKSLIFGYFPVKRKYSYREFLNSRLVGTIFASLLIAYATIYKDIAIAMVGAAIFIFSHSLIYLDIYRRERLGN